MKLLLWAALMLGFAVPAAGTEYWSGYDDDTGECIEIIVRYSEKLDKGADIFIRSVARGSQAESQATYVHYGDQCHARGCAMLEGMEHCYSVSR